MDIDRPVERDERIAADVLRGEDAAADATSVNRAIESKVILGQTADRQDVMDIGARSMRINADAERG